ncbi:phage integrase family protein [Cupriavidus pauculus]|uniref:phage integrase family protein n=1 Tax=Cupriavidus pauculus TaxID=82633 RepID=UPI001EE1C89A|nr:tyrosine-type recombinase/integrase [Cupriavidus pauculus]GJG94346.1 tyrosine-type recombinase/integrase [Cupriavidus pauculus]
MATFPASSGATPALPNASNSPPRAPRGRYSVVRPRLHRGHFAFLRAVAQGLSARAMWDRYLADAGAFDDGPRVHRMTGWIRAELGAAAARGGDFARARLLRLDLAPPAASPLPALADFARAEGLEGFSEIEQMSAYETTFDPALTRQRRRTALLHRQLDAIHTLEAQVARPVSRTDGCEAWLVDAVADRLRRAGLLTLGELMAHIQALGPPWWHPLRGVGARKAHAITVFLRGHADTLGEVPDLAVEPETGGAATLSVADTCSPCEPLERFMPPAALDGSAGTYRCPRAQCRLAADNDRDAILAWLASKGDGGVGAQGAGSAVGATQRAYRKEAERFLLWAVLARRCALSSITIEDAVTYRDFLLAPPADWCSVHTQPRWSARWRPLAGPLSPASCAYALGVLGNLFAFLGEQGYLSGNPWRAVRAPRAVTPGLDPGRGFTADQWALLVRELAALPPTSANQRLQFALPLLYDTGLRLSELVAATTDDLRQEGPPGQGGALGPDGWWLQVVGKGGRLREVPLPETLMRQLSIYLKARGLPGDPRQAGGAALLGGATDQPVRSPWANRLTVDPAAPIGPSTFHRQLKAFFRQCAETVAAMDPPAARSLRRASTHWLRHTHASHALAAGVPVQVVQQNLGHRSLATTTRYVRTEAAARQAAMAQFWAAQPV